MEMNKNTVLPIVIVLAIIVVIAGAFLIKSISTGNDTEYVETTTQTAPPVSQMTIALQQQLDAEKAKTIDANSKLDTANSQIDDYEDQVAVLQAELDALKATQTAAAATTLTGLYIFDLNDLNFDYLRCDEYVRQAKDVREDAEDDLDDAEDDLEEEEDDLTEIQADLTLCRDAYTTLTGNSTCASDPNVPCLTALQKSTCGTTTSKISDEIDDLEDDEDDKEDDVDDAEDEVDDREEDEEDADDMYDDIKSKCRGH